LQGQGLVIQSRREALSGLWEVLAGEEQFNVHGASMNQATCM
jgi:hypothetical protein